MERIPVPQPMSSTTWEGEGTRGKGERGKEGGGGGGGGEGGNEGGGGEGGNDGGREGRRWVQSTCSAGCMGDSRLKDRPRMYLVFEERAIS